MDPQECSGLAVTVACALLLEDSAQERRPYYEAPDRRREQQQRPGDGELHGPILSGVGDQLVERSGDAIEVECVDERTGIPLLAPSDRAKPAMKLVLG